MLEPTAGSISVLGLNPTKDDVAVKQVLGYIPERMQMYDWMTVDQVLEFVAGIYKNWSREDENQLAEKFRLVRHQKVGALSRGNRALLSLVIAMAHQPELVLLDECTSGMDAIARREFERSVIDALSGSGRTVLFAGHQIDEMERICDWVGILHDGKMLLEMTLDDLKRTIVGLRLTAAESLPTVLNNCKILSSRTSGKESYVTVRFDSPLGAIYDAASGIKVNEVVPLSLEEIFVAAVEAEENK
jgi:ABC-2 type transport system ATP-binding protein